MKQFFLVFFVIFIGFNLFSAGKTEAAGNEAIKTSEQKNSEQTLVNTGSTIQITGRVRVYGNEPHTYTGIVDEKGTAYSVYAPGKEAEIRRLQGHLVEFTVILLDKPQGYGSMFLKGGTVTPVSWRIIEN